MGALIQIRRLGVRYHGACSPDSALRPKPFSPFAGPPRSPHPRTPGECGCAGSIYRPSDTQRPGLEPNRQATPIFGRLPESMICLEGLASAHSIMDDKSMQGWTNPLLTPLSDPRTIVLVGRPTKTATPASYKAAFFKRVRAARMRFTENPPEMAKALGVPKDTYYRYEERTMLPHHLIPRFCELCDVKVDWLILGPSGSPSHHVEERTSDHNKS